MELLGLAEPSVLCPGTRRPFLLLAVSAALGFGLLVFRFLFLVFVSPPPPVVVSFLFRLVRVNSSLFWKK